MFPRGGPGRSPVQRSRRRSVLQSHDNQGAGRSAPRRPLLPPSPRPRCGASSPAPAPFPTFTTSKEVRKKTFQGANSKKLPPLPFSLRPPPLYFIKRFWGPGVSPGRARVFPSSRAHKSLSEALRSSSVWTWSARYYCVSSFPTFPSFLGGCRGPRARKRTGTRGGLLAPPHQKNGTSNLNSYQKNLELKLTLCPAAVGALAPKAVFPPGSCSSRTPADWIPAPVDR